MSIVLHPRAAPSDRLRVWLGLFNRTGVAPLQWSVNGSAQAPVTLRPLQSARPDTGAGALVNPATSRAFTGVYEFTGLQPATLYTIGLKIGSETCTLRARTLPAALPSGVDEWFNVMLVSCFHAEEDKAGLAGSAVNALQGTLRPHLTILLGDQVYLDLPSLQDFDDDPRWLAAKFERDYSTNWRGPTGYGQVLAAAPAISVPDDHEYWNNYPHPSPFIGNTWKQSGRDTWRRAARALYEAFQQPWPAQPGDAVVIDIPPLSFFLADTRTFRAEDRSRTMSTSAMHQFRTWIDRLKQEGRYGLFVTGQSLFENPAKELSGRVGDYALANYGDYRQIAEGLRELVDAGRPVLCITGDVHWGRVTRVADTRAGGRAAFYEVISSPTSLVTTIGQDQLSSVGAFFGGLFGRSDPWPRHSNADVPPEFLAHSVHGSRFHCSMIHPHKGNHVAVLSFRTSGGGVQFRVTYYSIHPDRAHRLATRVGPINLTPFSIA